MSATLGDVVHETMCKHIDSCIGTWWELALAPAPSNHVLAVITRSAAWQALESCAIADCVGALLKCGAPSEQAARNAAFGWLSSRLALLNIDGLDTAYWESFVEQPGVQSAMWTPPGWWARGAHFLDRRVLYVPN